jgi:large subunit ribosomal protein L10
MKTGTVFGKLVNAKEIEAISKLPSREALLSMLCSVLQGPVRNLAYTIQAIKEQKEKA